MVHVQANKNCTTSSTTSTILVACLVLTTTTAFAPHNPHPHPVIGSSTFVPQRSSTTYSNYNHNHQHSSSSASSSSSTALQMNLFDRFTRVVNANLNNVLKNLEDPEKIMNQAVEDMQGDLVKVRQSYAEITATQRRMIKQREQAQAVAEDWYKRAQLAMQRGNEDLAREALQRRQQNLEQSESLQQQIDAQALAVDKLYEGMQLLEKKILESKAKKDQMVARARTAQSTQKVNDMLGGITGKTSMDAFKRMEDKVEALEAAAEVSAEMGSFAGNYLPGAAESSIEREFRMLEGSASVDDELRKLKGLLSGSSSTTGSTSSDSSSFSSASSSSSAAPSNPLVDDEMEKLKREAGLY